MVHVAVPWWEQSVWCVRQLYYENERAIKLIHLKLVPTGAPWSVWRENPHLSEKRKWIQYWLLDQTWVQSCHYCFAHFNWDGHSMFETSIILSSLINIKHSNYKGTDFHLHWWTTLVVCLTCVTCHMLSLWSVQNCHKYDQL